MHKRKKFLPFILVLTLTIIITVVSTASEGFASLKLTNEEIEKIIEEVAIEKGIPSLILKAIAWKESKYRQFDSNGKPYVYYGNTGIMQINRVHRHLDQERLKYDLKYNIEAGADILLDRWHASGRLYPTIGDMDPNILEHWYFALWGYNGWLERNNPNVSGKRAYQEEIFQLLREKYNQPVTSIDSKYLPTRGLPKRDLWIPTPKNHNFGDLNNHPEVVFRDLIHHPKQEYIEELYALGIVSGVGNGLFNPDNYITREQITKILVDALGLDIIKDKVIAKDWENVSQWAKDYVITAYQHGIILMDEEGNINPKEFVSREEALIMLFEGFKKEPLNYQDLIVPITYKDFQKISPKALDAVAYLIGKEVLRVEEEKFLRPKDFITRGELCKLIYKAMVNLRS